MRTPLARPARSAAHRGIDELHGGGGASAYVEFSRDDPERLGLRVSASPVERTRSRDCPSTRAGARPGDVDPTLIGHDESMGSVESHWALMEPRAIHIDGDRIAYRAAGEGPGLLLIHGLAGSAVTWRHVMPALAERFRVVAPDLLGQGQSDKPRGEYSMGAHANTLRDLLDALGHERVTVVGQSLGGGGAPQFAYPFPERCERLVLVDSGGFGREVTFYLRMLTVPGFEAVFPLFCSPLLRHAGNRVAAWLARAGLPSTPASQ